MQAMIDPDYEFLVFGTGTTHRVNFLYCALRYVSKMYASKSMATSPNCVMIFSAPNIANVVAVRRASTSVNSISFTLLANTFDDKFGAIQYYGVYLSSPDKQST